MSALIHHLFISRGHNFFGHHGQEAGKSELMEVSSIECVAGRGILGDRFFDYKPNYKGQITFFAHEIFSALCEELKLPSAHVSATRRNVITEGLNLTELIGAEFTIQGVRFRGIEECKPCYWMNDAIGQGSEVWLSGRGGLRASILSDGILRVNKKQHDL